MRDTLRFILNGKLEEIRNCLPDETVLDFLRERKKLTGTKEGCSEGDCGACTVVLGEVVDGQLRYRAVNSCILFLPTLDGKQLITVEDLKQADGNLHPVQQAMVEEHGSQCGYCTPGFVMSMLAMFHDHQGEQVSRSYIDANLAGNLCRCTGYAPIIRAVQRSLANSETATRSDQFTQNEAEVLQQLTPLRNDEMLSISHQGRQFFSPTRIEQLCSTLTAHPGATVVAGATDVGLWVTKKLQQLQTVIYVGKVRELLEIKTDHEALQLSIGAAVSYTDAMPHIIEAYPDFEELLVRLGATQVRNAGTIGGNIANGSPIGDMPPALIALGAKLVLASSKGERVIELESFFIAYGQQDLKPGECVARILLPMPVSDLMFRTYKLSKRIEQDISALCVAFAIRLRDGKVHSARICYGGLAATPKRASHCEESLINQPWNEQTIENAMHTLRTDFSPISDMRASADYRILAAGNLLKRFYLETSAANYPLRLKQEFAGREQSA